MATRHLWKIKNGYDLFNQLWNCLVFSCIIQYSPKNLKERLSINVSYELEKLRTLEFNLSFILERKTFKSQLNLCYHSNEFDLQKCSSKHTWSLVSWTFFPFAEFFILIGTATSLHLVFANNIGPTQFDIPHVSH